EVDEPVSLSTLEDQQRLPRIMFENEAFIKIKDTLRSELGPALAEALEKEPPRVLPEKRRKKEHKMANKEKVHYWMKQDEYGVEQRKVQKEFTDNEGKMWRITS